ncbi:cytochrome P450 [Nocardiopsis mangrovi]|uniref:Cytochrome P450 n=1 Tax=Nocardiopsis mangrovi TaxID=1179818 RepID=A0ABV9E166_9ACTN
MNPILFDPWSPEFIADPFAGYTELRDRHPVHYYSATDQWLVSRHEDVGRCLRDPRVVRSYLHAATDEDMGRAPAPRWQEPFWRLNFGSLDAEPPDHTRLRRLLGPPFTVRAVDALGPRCDTLARSLVDDLVRRGGGDLLSVVAEPLALALICDIVGVPEDDRHLMAPWASGISGLFVPNHSARDAADAVRASAEFDSYLRRLARHTPPDHPGVMGSMVAALRGGGISEQELVCSAAMLLTGGLDSGRRMVTMAVLTLLHHPDQWRLLGRTPELMPTALEELIRYDSPIHMFERWALEDIDLDGVRIPRGAEIALLFGSADRDPRRFADPDRLDLTRSPNPHLGLGAGVHFCLGVHLVRREVRAVLEALAERAPNLRLTAEPGWGPGYNLRSPVELRVEV